MVDWDSDCLGQCDWHLNKYLIFAVYTQGCSPREKNHPNLGIVSPVFLTSV